MDNQNETKDDTKFCIKFNSSYNSDQSDGTIMYSKSKNRNHPTYKNLQPGTEVWIIRSGRVSGILMHKGVISIPDVHLSGLYFELRIVFTVSIIEFTKLLWALSSFTITSTKFSNKS
jgi:hypothetical protein